jgi:DNA polymerase-4
LTLSEVATELALTALADHPRELEITLLAVSVSKLVDQPVLQLELPLGLADDRHRPGSAMGASRLAIDHSVDAIRARFGRDSVGYAATVFSSEGRVPDAFRELAEHDDLR